MPTMLLLVVLRRIVDRFADIRERGEVHHRFDALLLHRGNDPLTIEQIGRH